MSQSLSKQNLISFLTEETDISEEKAEKVLNAMIKQLRSALKETKSLSLTDFGLPIIVRRQVSSPREEEGALIVENIVFSEEELSKMETLEREINEQRKLSRRNFIIDLEVVNRETGDTIGSLGDITREGIMIISDGVILQDKLFPIKIDLPEEAGETLQIVFNAQSIRCVETVHENIYITGLKIQELDANNATNIDYLIKTFAV
jgi:hypothetical protein